MFLLRVMIEFRVFLFFHWLLFLREQVNEIRMYRYHT